MPARSSDLLARVDRAEAHDLRRQRRDAGRDDPRQRREAELLRLGVAHDDERGGAVVERAGVAGRDGAGLAEHRLERLHLLQRRAGPRAVVLAHHGAVGQRDRRDLALEEAVGDRLLGAVLALDAPLVLLEPADAAQRGDVLGRLAHRDVDVGQRAVRARVGPRRVRRRGGAAVRSRASSNFGFSARSPSCRPM